MHHGSGLSPALLLCPAVELFLLLLLGLVLEIGSRSSYEHEPEHEHEHEPEHEYRIRNEQGSVREKRNRKMDREAETSRPVGATVSDSGTSSRIEGYDQMQRSRAGSTPLSLPAGGRQARGSHCASLRPPRQVGE